MLPQSLVDTTAAHGLEEGIALALHAEDSGDWKAVVDWLAHRPEHAVSLAEFLATQRGLVSVAAQLRTSANRTGAMVGGLELREEIGRGAMGVIYKAADPVLKREVAVKMIRGDRFSTHELARFRVEAETVASLDHPNIVRVLASGEMNGEPYLVMPLLKGGTLAEWLAKCESRQRPAKEAARLVRDVALGIHHAHDHGLIHRDLKPANILLDEKGQPHVADFGLARRVDMTDASSGEMAGTVKYMAPEQASGEKHLTKAVDVHAIGIILFELLTGTVPYGNELGGILSKLTDPAVQAPPVKQFRSDVPSDLEAVCMKCLEKEPAKRYASAQELADDLTAFIEDKPVSAQLPGLWDWMRQLARTRPEPNKHYSWPVTVWFGFIALITHAAIYGLVQSESPAVWVWVANCACGAAMSVVLWWYMLRKFRQLPVTERHSLILAVGHIIGMIAVMTAYVPFSFSASARESLAMYPALAALSGVCLFTLGSTNWSRFFPIAMGMLSMVPVLASFPESSPLLYGSLNAAVMWYWSMAKRNGFTPRSARET